MTSIDQHAAVQALDGFLTPHSAPVLRPVTAGGVVLKFNDKSALSRCLPSQFFKFIAARLICPLASTQIF